MHRVNKIKAIASAAGPFVMCLKKDFVVGENATGRTSIKEYKRGLSECTFTRGKA
jgi:hypothetical protein